MAVSAATCSSKGRSAGARQRAGDPALAALLEELVHLGGVRSAEVPEQLGGEVAVALGVERLGGRGQLVDVARPAPPRPSGDLVAVVEQPVLFEPGQLLADGGRRQRERRGHGDASSGPWRLSRLRMARRVVGSCCERRLAAGGAAGRVRASGSGGHGRIRWTSPNSCHR